MTYLTGIEWDGMNHNKFYLIKEESFFYNSIILKFYRFKITIKWTVNIVTQHS